MARTRPIMLMTTKMVPLTFGELRLAVTPAGGGYGIDVDARKAAFLWVNVGNGIFDMIATTMRCEMGSSELSSNGFRCWLYVRGCGRDQDIVMKSVTFGIMIS